MLLARVLFQLASIHCLRPLQSVQVWSSLPQGSTTIQGSDGGLVSGNVIRLDEGRSDKRVAYDCGIASEGHVERQRWYGSHGGICPMFWSSHRSHWQR